VNHPRKLILALIVLGGATWASGCGDGSTEPPPPEPSSPAAVTVSPATAQLTALGATVQLSAQVRDQSGQAMAGATVTWSSGDAGVAAVNASGLVTAAGNGTATITASAGGVSGSATVTVAQEVSAVAVSPAADTVASGDTLRLTAEATDANEHLVTDAEFSWTSSDASVALVDANGLVTGVTEGEATITATAGSAFGTAHIAVSNPDRAALVTFYEATDGPGWIENSGWLSDRPLGDWHGVTTGPEGRVTALRLPASNLAGSIPPDLSNLSSLETLDLERNELAGPIPPELGTLSNLKTLILGVNDLAGRIPAELGDLSNLEVLRLRRNDLSGPVPPELASLRNLTRLGLERNDLEGQIPAGFVGLERLRSFHFADNEGLCVSGSAAFTAWLAQLQVRVGPLCNEQDRTVLVSLYEAAGGMNWTRSDGWLGDDALEDWHGVAADSAGRVTGLDMSGNGLMGRLPVSIGLLASLTSLRIDDNAALTGGLPLSLTELSLEELNYTDTRLCVPPEASFGEWLASIPSHEGTDAECTPLSEREVLVLLYEATGGPGWTDDENWLSDRPFGEWRGVTTGGEGQVASIDLSRNNLTGAVPSAVGTLAGLETLNLARNSLTGRIPSGLGNLSGLQILSLGVNALTGPIPPELGNLSSLRELSLAFNNLTGSIPSELGSLSDLERLDLRRNALTEAIPSELGSLSGLEVLSLGGNDLAGPIPPELGSLSALESLSLDSNDLTGPIPPELGSLSGLRTLSLNGNDLMGPIPPELGSLSSLERLSLYWNDLTGPIPPELGSLSSLRTLYLISSGLTGPIPPELGNLSSLNTLRLDDNSLTGPIPPELGDLSALVSLNLDSNGLTGSIPPELGGLVGLTALTAVDNELTGSLPLELAALTRLRQLRLVHNAGMSGALPPGLTALARLNELQLGGTGLCAPADAAIQDWLGRIPIARVRRCETSEGSAAYLTQAVQSREYPVPLVAGEPALLRVLVTASQATSEGIPPVRATFYVGGAEMHSVDIPGSATSIPTDVGDAESALEKSANAEIPGSVIQPGLEMVIEIDPANTLDPGLGVTKRIPGTGRMPVRIEAMPTLDVTFVPFLWAQNSDSSLVDIARAMAADPQGHEMLSDTRVLLPVHELDVKAHEPVLTSTTNVSSLNRQVALIRAMEGAAGYYMGLLPEEVVGGQSGIAQIGGRTGFSVADPWVIAHELGHNMSLRHAPCGGAGGPDPAFPQQDASIGTWGYHFGDDSVLVPPHVQDFMSYCGPPRWVSDYSFTKALNHRVGTETVSGATTVAQASAGDRTKTILVWGGVDNLSNPFLEPAFVAHAPPALPTSPGEYEVVGRTAGGGELFSLSFDMPEIADGDGSSSFVFALPARPEWAGSLASLTLSGPGGFTTMDQTTDQPMAILRDPTSGQIRGILHDPSPAVLTLGGAATGSPAGADFEIVLSRGIPREREWRRE